MLGKTGFFLALMLGSQIAVADAEIAERYVQNPALVGEARMKVMLWDVFDATLHAAQGQFDRTQPFVLSLSYLRTMKGQKIVDKTMEEMEKQRRFNDQELASWSDRLSEIIGDVDSRTTITGVRDKLGNTLFYRNGAPIGEITDARFTEGFFDIWLGEETSQPRLRKQLLGSAQS